MLKLILDLGEKSYPLYIGSNILQGFWAEIKKKYAKIFLIVDKNFYSLYSSDYSFLESSYDNIFLLDVSEENKNIQTATEVYNFLSNRHIQRQDVIVAIGGGVTGDLAGFVASTILRGIDFVIVPTTLLSQIDSSIGGKNGVNLEAGKNLVGTFKQPTLCIIDTSFLKSLELDEIVSGYAEILKHSLILDSSLFDELKKENFTNLVKSQKGLQSIIFRSCEIKAKVVEKDETEKNIRMLLNFGHSLGHFVEAVSGFKRYRHGFCVLSGIGFACYVSLRFNLLDKPAYNEIHQHIASFFKPLTITPSEFEQFAKILKNDKKSKSDFINFIVLRSIGKADILYNTSIELIQEYLAEYVTKQESLLKLTN